MLRKMIGAAAIMLLAGTASADIWTEADTAFADRLNNREAIAEARTLYKEILADATGPDALRAASQLGRLAIYEGEMLLPKSASEERMEIFSDCWCRDPRVSGLVVPEGECREPGFIDAISPDNLGEPHPAYYYFHGVCLAYWGEQASLRQKLAFTSWITWSIDEGQQTDTRFDGGGLHRLTAGVYSNPQADLLGIYQPEYALEEIYKALRSESYPGDPSNGSSYYDNWKGLVEVLMELDRNDEAVEVCEEALPELQELIEEDELPAGRGPEAIYAYKHLKKFYQELTGDEWEDDLDL